jgi:hypothetical protein
VKNSKRSIKLEYLSVPLHFSISNIDSISSVLYNTKCHAEVVSN